MQLSTQLTSSQSRGRLFGLAVAVLLAEALWLGAGLILDIQLQAPSGTVAPEPVAIGPLTVALASVIPSLLGWAVMAALERLTPHARRVWLVLALLALAASLLLGPLSGSGVTTANRLVLALMHLAVAGAVMTALYRTSAGRLAQPTPAPPRSGGLPSVAGQAHSAHRTPLHADPQQPLPAAPRVRDVVPASGHGGRD